MARKPKTKPEVEPEEVHVASERPANYFVIGRLKKIARSSSLEEARRLANEALDRL